jgi:tetratricopeptide (TPR) repeat protein
MKTACRIILIAVFFWLWAGPVPATVRDSNPEQDHARPFIDALEAYKNGDYAAAIEGFSDIARSGVQNGKLYYNLGNAYLKNAELGPAILWYERALKLLPNDPDLIFNYQYARSLTKDAPEEGSPLLRILFFWKYRLSNRAIVLAAIGCSLIFWAALIAWQFTRRRSIRWVAAAAALPALIFVLTAGVNYYESAHRRQAIVLPSQTAVRSGLQQGSTELFKLHAGAKVTVLKSLKDHYQIRYSNDKIGWVPEDEVGVIP